MMKHFLLSLLVGLLMQACTFGNKQAVKSKDLAGKYDIDFSLVLASLEESATSEEERVALALTSLFLEDTKLTVQFEETKMVLDGDGSMFKFLWNVVEKTDKMPIVMDYQIRQDSVLYTRESSDSTFEQVAILRKLTDSYDYLKMIPFAENNEAPVEILLRKQVVE